MTPTRLLLLQCRLAAALSTAAVLCFHPLSWCGVAGSCVSRDRLPAVLLNPHGSCGSGQSVVGVVKLAIPHSRCGVSTSVCGCIVLMHLQAAAASCLPARQVHMAGVWILPRTYCEGLF